MATSKQRARAFDALAMRGQVSMQRALIKAKNSYIDKQLAHYAKTGMYSDALDAEHKQAVQELLSKAYRLNIQRVSKEAIKQLEGKTGVQMIERKQADLWDTLFIAWMNKRGFERAKTISATTRTDLVARVNAAFQQGLPEREVIQAGAAAKGASRFRAIAIARTETHNASTYAAQEASKQYAAEVDLQIMKQWVPVIDDRTREAHADMAGSDPIPMDAYFDVGGEMMERPGEGSPENVINCRCQCVYVTI